MKKDNLFTAIMLIASAVIFIVSGAIFVHSATTQSTRSTLNVTYVADNVSFSASAFYQLADTGAKVDLVDTSNNNATTVTFTPSANSTTKTLSAVSPVELTVNKQYVLFTYAFTNTATSGGYCIKVSLTDGTTSSSNVDVTYLASDSKYCAGATPTVSELTSFKSSVSSTSAPTNVYIQAQETKYFYILVEIDNPYLDSGYNSTALHGLVWSVENTEYVTAPLEETPLSYFFFDGNTIMGVVRNRTLPSTVVIPEGVVGLWMATYMGGFVNRSELISLYIPSSLANVSGSGFFTGCSNLSSIIVSPDNADYDSRNNCNAIIATSSNKLVAGCKNTTIPSSVTSIVSGAFAGCAGLTSISIPSTVTSFVGGNAYYDCTGIASISVDANNSVYDSRNNCNAIIETSSNTLITGCKNTTIPNTVTSIGSYAFQGCTGLTSITIPSSVTSIGNGAFEGCTGLTSITIPSSVTSISARAFRNCTGLTSITIPNTVTSIGGSAFEGCTGLTSITIPSSVASIEYRAFEGCTNLASISVDANNSVYDSRNNCNAIIETSSNYLLLGCKNTTIPNTVTSIDSYAFKNCTGLTSITIPSSVTSIGFSAFSGCTNLASISVDANNSVYDSRNNCNAIIKTSSNELILGCKNTTIPNTVTSIGSSAFAGHTGLTSITIPSSVTSIGSNAFEGCTGLTSITIPSSVTSIAFGLNGSFHGCTGLATVSVEAGNTVYDSRDNCNAIIETSSNTLSAGFKNSTIPSTVTSIRTLAFDGCSSLTSITIPNSVTSLGNSAFSLTGLTSIIIPASVTTIGRWMFDGCENMESIYFEHSDISTITTINNGAFTYTTPWANYIRYYFKDSEANVTSWGKFIERYFPNPEYNSY